MHAKRTTCTKNCGNGRLVYVHTHMESSPVTTEGKRIERNFNSPNLPKNILGKGATTNNLEMYEQKEKTQ
jgi:hypothetical protein